MVLGGEGCVTPTQRQAIEKMLSESEIRFQTTVYSDVPHGFAVHHGLGKKYDKFVKEQAFLQAVQWLDFHMKADGGSRNVSWE